MNSGLLLAALYWNGDAHLQVRKNRPEALYWLKQASKKEPNTVPWARYHYEDPYGSRVRRRFDQTMFLGALKQNKSSSLSSSFFGSSIVEPRLISFITKYLCTSEVRSWPYEDSRTLESIFTRNPVTYFSDPNHSVSSNVFRYFSSAPHSFRFNGRDSVVSNTRPKAFDLIFRPYLQLQHTLYSSSSLYDVCLLRFAVTGPPKARVSKVHNVELRCSSICNSSPLSLVSGLRFSKVTSSLLELKLTSPRDIDIKYLVDLDLSSLKKLTMCDMGRAATDLTPLLEAKLPCIDEVSLEVTSESRFSLVPQPHICLKFISSSTSSLKPEKPFLSDQDTSTLIKLDMIEADPLQLSALSTLNAPNLTHLLLKIESPETFNVLKGANFPSLKQLDFSSSCETEPPSWIQNTFPQAEIVFKMTDLTSSSDISSKSPYKTIFSDLLSSMTHSPSSKPFSSLDLSFDTRFEAPSQPSSSSSSSGFSFNRFAAPSSKPLGFLFNSPTKPPSDFSSGLKRPPASSSKPSSESSFSAGFSSKNAWKPRSKRSSSKSQSNDKKKKK